MGEKFLAMRGISKAYPGVQALKDVEIAADAGEVVALLGENGAGKSTLMNALGGVIRRDAGEIFIGGQVANIRSVADAQRAGIAFIHQELSLFKQLTVQENLFVEGFPRRRGTPFIDRKAMRERTERIFREFEMDIPAAAKVSRLTMGQQQIVEIASAVLKDAKIIILDEPSTSLTTREREKLYAIVRKLRSEGKAIVYITHDIESALNLCDRAYVLRDGRNAGEGSCARLTKDDVIRMMIGSKAGKLFYKTARQIADTEVVLRLTDICTDDKLNHVNLELRRGEVYGLYGLIGSGRTELIRAFYGLDKLRSGKVEVKGREVKNPSPRKLKELGIGYLTENRRDEGLFLELGINLNITITALKKIQNRFGILSKRRDEEITRGVIDMLDISTPGPYQLSGKLSGGNQQKVVIGKWMHLAPDILILDEPTRGIDVGAKSEIYRLIDEIARGGVSILLVSSEIEEILGMCDRVGVMARGALVADLEGADINQSEIIRHTMR
ncbi:MAG: sugar ABC transporter ATP-binding protein [Clostridiales bacterium]|nr:sugar ABC transporter ATP-binding protein [Clostridiales bacterium]